MATLVEVKQVSDLSAQSLGLDKYNRSKFPDVFEIMQPGRGQDGRWITGLDEGALAIKQIKDPEVRKARQDEVKERREDLERTTGHDLSGNSDFWLTFYIKIRDKLPLNMDVPMDNVKYWVLLANRFAAPELEATVDPDYLHSKFYIHRTDSEDGQKSVKSRERDKAISDLYLMYENPHKMKLIGRYIFGTRIKESMGIDSVYNIMREGITNDKEGTIVRKFAEAVVKTIEELQYKLIIDEAIEKHVIRIREGYYQRGNATYGKTLKEVIKFLSSVENSSEFASVKEEVEEKRYLA
jgi:hypothetical protein